MTYIKILILVCIVLGEQSCNSYFRRSSVYLIPDGYVGWVKIDFKDNNTNPLPIENGKFLFVIPPNGYFKTSTNIEYGVGRDEFYYVSGSMRKPLKDSGWGKGGMIWGGGTGRKLDGNNKVIEIYINFFVGTEEEYKKHGAGHENSIGPIPELKR